MLGLPRVPTCCLSLLRLLVHTGTRAIAPTQGDQRTEVDCSVQQTVLVTAQVTSHLMTSHHITPHTPSYCILHEVTSHAMFSCSRHVNNLLIFHLSIRHLPTFCLGVRRDAQGPRNRGTRTEALSLLGQFLPLLLLLLFLFL